MLVGAVNKWQNHMAATQIYVIGCRAFSWVLIMMTSISTDTGIGIGAATELLLLSFSFLNSMALQFTCECLRHKCGEEKVNFYLFFISASHKNVWQLEK